jgi:Tat protein translocase TatB subunit
MFDISWTEFLLIGVVALIVIGPKELPAVLRTLGQWTRKVRSMAADFQNQFQEAMREAEMADLKKQVDDIARYQALRSVPRTSAPTSRRRERTLRLRWSKRRRRQSPRPGPRKRPRRPRSPVLSRRLSRACRRVSHRRSRRRLHDTNVITGHRSRRKPLRMPRSNFPLPKRLAMFAKRPSSPRP